MSEVLVVDFETISNRPRDAAIISIGAIACNWEDVPSGNFTLDDVKTLESKGLYLTFKTKRQIEVFGATFTEHTMDWWSKQSEEARAVFKCPNKVEIDQLPFLLNRYCEDTGVDKKTTVLIRAPHFDFTIIDFHYSNLNAQLPFNHWKVRDVRSIVDVCCETEDGYVPGFKDYMAKNGIVGHNALSDCVKDLIQVKMALTQDFMTP